MKTIKFQLIGWRDKEALSDIQTCNVIMDSDDPDAFDVKYGEKKTDSAFRVGDMVILPRRIFLLSETPDEGMVGYGIQQGAGWSMMSFFCDIKIISVEDANPAKK